VVHETHEAWAKLVRGTVEEEVEAQARAQMPEKPTTPQLTGMKRSTLKRNLSVPRCVCVRVRVCGVCGVCGRAGSCGAGHAMCDNFHRVCVCVYVILCV
jgi:hypothetical protein